MTSSSITQIEAVRRALEAEGGVSTLGTLYRSAIHIPGSSWSGTQNPFANIRRIVQTSDLFWKVRPGLWALKSEEERLVAEDKIPAKNTSDAEVEKFNHSYYQGLLVQWGNLEGHNTSVPAQDKNRLFLKEPLHKIATLSAPPNFTFTKLIQRVEKIDVGWYNNRDFPRALFEVEHSTDISNSLGKFVDFQDFRARFVIVAEEVRRNSWNNKMQQAQFASIKGRVEFLSYDDLAKCHANAAQKAFLQSF